MGDSHPILHRPRNWSAGGPHVHTAQVDRSGWIGVLAALGALAALEALAVPSGAFAQADPSATRPVHEVLTLTPESTPCLDRPSLLGRVEALLGNPQVDAAITVELTIRQPEDPGPAATLITRRDGVEAAQRAFDALPEACGARLDAVALAIALAIDHTLLERLGGQTGGDGGTTASGDGGTGEGSAAEGSTSAEDGAGGTGAGAASATGASTSGREGQTGEQTRPGSGGPRVVPALLVGVSAVADLLDDAAVVGALGAELEIQGWLMLGVRGLVSLPTEAPLGTGRIRSWLLGGRLEACVGGELAPVHLAGCLAAAGGVLLAEGRDFEPNDEATKPWMAAFGGVRVRYPVHSSLQIGGSIEGVLGLLRPRLHVESVDMDGVSRVTDAVTAPMAGLSVGLELVLRLP